MCAKLGTRGVSWRAPGWSGTKAGRRVAGSWYTIHHTPRKSDITDRVLGTEQEVSGSLFRHTRSTPFKFRSGRCYTWLGLGLTRVSVVLWPDRGRVGGAAVWGAAGVLLAARKGASPRSRVPLALPQPPSQPSSESSESWPPRSPPAAFNCFKVSFARKTRKCHADERWQACLCRRLTSFVSRISEGISGLKFASDTEDQFDSLRVT
eukprot:1267062-Rhodomonas_salina.2